MMQATRRMVSTLTLVTLLVAGSAVAAKNPWQDTTHPVYHADAEMVVMGPVDVPALLMEDERDRLAGLPPRFAAGLPVDLDPWNAGTWQELPDGTARWRLRISSPGALSLNLGFSRYHMPFGGSLRLMGPDLALAVRPFTHADNKPHGQLWTPIVKGDEMTIEVVLPAALRKRLELRLAWVNHGYQDPAKITSGSCNVDVICPDGDDWRDEIRSVAALTLSGRRICTGFLVNNGLNDLQPLLMTANHCGVRSSNASGLIAYWNYENSSCRDTSTSGLTGDGTLSEFVSGATHLASSPTSDFTLVMLDDMPEHVHNVYWAGWDNSAADPEWAACIHHPSVEEKRISFENDATATTSWYGYQSPGDGTHIQIEDWDVGTTEGGSSGSPLFNQQHRVVGQLHGGDAACGNNAPDWFGRLSVSWEGDGTPDTRLKDWLDPLASGISEVGGQDTTSFFLRSDQYHATACAGGTAQYAIAVYGYDPAFSGPVTLSLSGAPSGVTGNFLNNPAGLGTTSTLTIESDSTVATGDYILGLVGAANGTTLTSKIGLSVARGLPSKPVLLSPLDGEQVLSTSPALSWRASGASGLSTVEVATDKGFSNIVYSAQTEDSSHVVATTLASLSSYYWRVTASNACGTTSPSTPFRLVTGLTICSSPQLAIPDSSPLGVSDTIVIDSSIDIDITDLDVSLVVEHTYLGDLSATLRHVETGVAITLFDQPGYPVDQYGCSSPNIDVTLDDSAAETAEDACDDNPAMGGVLRPDEPLSSFLAGGFSGTWELTIIDNYSEDIGELVRWCLIPKDTPKPRRPSRRVTAE